MSGDGECADVWQTVPICEHSGEAGVSAVESTDLAFVATVALIVFAVIIVFAIAIAIVAAVTVVLVTVVLIVPMTFMQPPALLFMVIVRMAPVGALKRRLCPMTRDPRAVAAFRWPVSLGPYPSWARRHPLPV